MDDGVSIRLDWDYALGHIMDIGSKIGWGFTTQDLLVLGALHEMGLHREEIIYLLEDCNFHSECSLLDAGEYSEYRKLIFE